MDDCVVPGSFYVEAVWVVGSIPRSHPEHCHDFDEVVGFVGSNMDDPTDLGGEIDFVVDGEKMTITKTCFIYVPERSASLLHTGLWSNFQVFLTNFRVGIQFLNRTGKTDARLIHKVNTACQRHGDLEIMFDQKDRNTGLTDILQHIP